MSEDTLAWVQGAEGRSILTALHIAGMMLLSCSIIGSFVMTGRMLFWRGPRPGRTVVGVVHVSLAVALAVLWVSGAGLVVGRDVLVEWPDQLTVKLAGAGVLTMGVWIAHVVVPPLLHSRRRPLVDALGWRGLFAAIAIQSVSLSCWATLIAYSFSDVVRGMPVTHVLALAGGIATALAVAWLVIAGFARSARHEVDPRGARRTKARRRAPTEPPAQPLVLRQPPTPQPPLHEGPRAAPAIGAGASTPPPRGQVRQAVPLPPAALQSAPVPAPTVHRAPVSPAQELQQLRAKLAQEWFRSAPAPDVHNSPAGLPHAERQRLIQDWLRRPLQR